MPGLGANTWLGTLDEGWANSAVAKITFDGTQVYGSIDRAFRSYRLRSGEAGKLYLMEVEPALFPEGDCAVGTLRSLPREEAGAWVSAPPFSGAQPRVAADLCKANSPTPPMRKLDILIVHTPAVADAILQANNLIAELNQVFANSHVNVHAALVGVSQVAFNEAGRHHGIIQRELFCKHNDARIQCQANQGDPETPVLGRLDEVFALRDAVSADLVMMLIAQGATAKRTCGAATGAAPAEDDAGPSPGVDYSPFAFGVVGDSCAGGGSYTFAHEVGHLLGGEHDWRHANHGTGGGMYGYSRGYVSDGGAMDVMADRECTLANCFRVPVFSDPDLQHNGFPMGVRNELNGRLNPTAKLCRQTSDASGASYRRCAADMQCAVQQYASVVEGYRVPVSIPQMPPPGEVGAVRVTCPEGYMPGYNKILITPPSQGVVEYYTVAMRRVKYGDGTWQQFYSGPSASPLVRVSAESYVRARACNSGGCGPAVQSGMTARPGADCL
ncbi:M12 family metallo-peptidase [Stigmatella erecta]|uniref:Metallo-peptidase family M12B Reprolysin-like n=1 Tax=Stigmatella erecta TaxID=83460 RepID=A0A1I0LD73_9BACT|nr:M12 family metallo-peptidase [Stigmatella erecta]SEU38059.1 Metallo-peptidase family M12B Reprolysin-like [Stigmatella erecta]